MKIFARSGGVVYLGRLADQRPAVALPSFSEPDLELCIALLCVCSHCKWRQVEEALPPFGQVTRTRIDHLSHFANRITVVSIGWRFLRRRIRHSRFTLRVVVDPPFQMVQKPTFKTNDVVVLIQKNVQEASNNGLA
jgi:hypothetical protein